MAVPSRQLTRADITGGEDLEILSHPLSSLSLHFQYNTSFEPDVWQDGETDIDPGIFIEKIPLSPWANYTFRVYARNELGVSPPSPISRVCSTAADTPDKNPDNVKGEGIVAAWF